MKKFLSILSIATLGLSLIACSEPETTSVSNDVSFNDTETSVTETETSKSTDVSSDEEVVEEEPMTIASFYEENGMSDANFFESTEEFEAYLNELPYVTIRTVVSTRTYDTSDFSGESTEGTTNQTSIVLRNNDDGTREYRVIDETTKACADFETVFGTQIDLGTADFADIYKTVAESLHLSDYYATAFKPVTTELNKSEIAIMDVNIDGRLTLIENSSYEDIFNTAFSDIEAKEIVNAEYSTDFDVNLSNAIPTYLSAYGQYINTDDKASVINVSITLSLASVDDYFTENACGCTDCKMPDCKYHVKEEEEVTYTYTDLDCTKYAKASMNVRDLPCTDGNKVGKLSTNDEVHVTGQCNETGWYRFEYGDTIAYGHNDYLVDEKVTVTVSSSSNSGSVWSGYPIGNGKSSFGDYYIDEQGRECTNLHGHIFVWTGSPVEYIPFSIDGYEIRKVYDFGGYDCLTTLRVKDDFIHTVGSAEYYPNEISFYQRYYGHGASEEELGVYYRNYHGSVSIPTTVGYMLDQYRLNTYGVSEKVTYYCRQDIIDQANATLAQQGLSEIMYFYGYPSETVTYGQ